MDLYYFKWVLPFCALLLLGIALDELQRQKDVVRRRFQLWLLTLLLSIFAMQVVSEKFAPEAVRANAAMFCYGLFLFFALRAARPEAWRLSLLGGRQGLNLALAGVLLAGSILVGPLFPFEQDSFTRSFGFNPKLEALAERHRTEPFRVAVLGIHPAQAQMAGLETFGGLSPIFYRGFKTYAGEVLAPQLQDARIREIYEGYWYHILLSDWRVVPRFTARVSSQAEPADWNLALLAAMNVRYLVSAMPIPRLETTDLGSNHQSESETPALRVYRLPGALPRGYLVPTAEVLASADSVLARIDSASIEDLARTAFFVAGQAPRPPDEISTGGCGESRLLSYGPDRLDYAIEAARPCYLVVSNNFDPKWRASMDGVPVPIFLANRAFQAIPVPKAGPHQVTLQFDDPVFPEILAVLPGGILLILMSPFARARRGHGEIKARRA